MIRGRFSISTLPDNKRRTGPEVFSDPRRRNTYNYAFTGSGIREAAFDPGPCISRDAGQYLISVATAIRINNSSIAGQRRGAVQRKLSNRNDRSQRKVVPITYYLLHRRPRFRRIGQMRRLGFSRPASVRRPWKCSRGDFHDPILIGFVHPPLFSWRFFAPSATRCRSRDISN